jgi:hypothetical protein
MGLMRFLVTPPERLTDEVAQQAYVSGVDRATWETRATADGGELALHRAVSDSGNLHLPWPVEGRGWLTLSTGSLLEQPQPYLLPLELARGTVNQLRNQLADWQMIGLVPPEGIAAKVEEAVRCLAQAVVRQDDPPAAAQLSEEAIRIALDASDAVVAAYVEQALAARRRGGAKINTMLAGDLGAVPLDDATAGQFLAAFNAANVPVCWRETEAVEGRFAWTVPDAQIEWCRANGLKVCAGPLLQLDHRGLPDWLCLWEGDFDSVLSFVTEFVRAAVSRYRGKIDVWQCAARINTAETLKLTEEEKLRLTARALELVHSLDPKAATVVSFDQPWAEYMARRDIDFPPLHLADALIRAGLDLRGLILEVNCGYYPGGTLPRTLLEVSRQLDYWSALGLPLAISLCAPSGGEADPLAARPARVSPGPWTAKNQQAWIARYLPLVLAKSYVQGVLWSQLRDDQPHDFPHGGLFDRQGRPKLALRTLASIRQTLLK